MAEEWLDPASEAPEEAEWLGLLLGPRGAGARRRAQELLAWRGLPALSRTGVRQMMREGGLGAAAARRVVAAFALARRLETRRHPPRAPLHSPDQVYECLRGRLRDLEQETFWVLLLDGRHRLRRTECVTAGTLTRSLVHPREVFRLAVREAAAALVCAHNHPSGDPEPSLEDLEVTRRLRSAGELLGIPLLDHVVVARDGYVSIGARLELSRPAGLPAL